MLVLVYADAGHGTTTALHSWGVAHRELWKALWDRGREIEVVAVVRTLEESSRAGTVLANWARDPRPSEMDKEMSRDISLRRKSASDPMDQPLKVLCELGGWRDDQTVLKCYQRPDAGHLRKALDNRRRVHG